MAGSIQDFVSRYQYGARANLYKVQIDFSGDFEPLEFFAKSAQIPGRTVGSIPIKYLNNTINYPGDVTYAEWTLTILNDEGFQIRRAIEAWMKGIKDHGQTASTLAGGLWHSTAAVTALGPNMQVLREYEFLYLFPTDLSTIELSFESADTMQEYTATFNYSYWDVKK